VRDKSDGVLQCGETAESLSFWVRRQVIGAYEEPKASQHLLTDRTLCFDVMDKSPNSREWSCTTVFICSLLCIIYSRVLGFFLGVGECLNIWGIGFVERCQEPARVHQPVCITAKHCSKTHYEDLEKPIHLLIKNTSI
jgi:hypothetical protein